MSLKIQIGTPPSDGRYVIYTPCQSRQIREWGEPHIATWHNGRWIFGDPVMGWIGPLPLCNQAILTEAHFRQEYDL